MAGERRLHGDPGRLRVAHLADQDDVGILPEDGPQASREREPRAHVHLPLREAVELHLDGILQRHDIDLLGIDELHERIEGRRLPRARGAARDHEPLRSPEDVTQGGLRGVLQAEASEGDDLLARQDPEDDLLPLRRRERRHPELHALAAVHVDGDLPVLRQAPLRDVHLGENLHARHHVRRHGEGDGLHVDQRPVDPQPHVHHVVLRLEVDVARPLRHRETHELVDEHHRVPRDRLQPCSGHVCPRVACSTLSIRCGRGGPCGRRARRRRRRGIRPSRCTSRSRACGRSSSGDRGR